MLITYLKDQNLLKVEAVEFTNFLSTYTSVSLIGSLNCKLLTPRVQSVTEIATTTSSYYLIGSILYIKPSIFNLTKYIDGIYTISLKLTINTGFKIINTCAFIDDTFKCKVAVYLENVIIESKPYNKSDKVGHIVHLLHYGLVNGSNCGCNCEELCQVFKELKDMLDKNQPLNTKCGC